MQPFFNPDTRTHRSMTHHPQPRGPRVLARLRRSWLALILGAGSSVAAAQDVDVGPFTLPPGETVTIEFEADIADPFPTGASSVSNQGQVSSDNPTVLTNDPDSLAAGDPTVTPVIQEIDADVSIAKSGPTQVATGGTIMYTLMVSNSGPDEAPNVVVTDTLPAGVTFVSATSPGCTEASGTVTCTLASVAVTTVNLTIEVTAPNTPGTLTNSVTVDSDATDNMPGNNSDTFDTTVLELQADLSVAKSDSPDPVQAGQQLVYTVTVMNAGPDPAQNVVASDTLPAGVTFVSTSGCAEDPNGVPDCTLETIAANSSKQYTITVTVNSGTPDGTLTNSVSVTSDTPDPNTANNSDTEETTVNTAPVVQADLAVTKSDSPDPVQAGNNLTYTMTVTNNGPSNATGVTMTDTLPAGVNFVSATPNQGSCTGTSTVVCNLGSLAAAASATVTLMVTPTAPGTITNTASVTGNEPDPNTANDSDTEETTVASVVLVLCAGLTPTRVGTPGNDTLSGTNGPDVTHGLGGNDTIRGRNGNDVICGGEGADTLRGNDGRDQLLGENGADTLRGDDGRDTILGGKDNDTLNGNDGRDALDGGEDTDTCNGGSGADTAANCETVTSVP